MSGDRPDEPHDLVDLLHPFYLDTDMSMAFAAALAGGVALEREDIERDTHESEAVRKLRGNLRLFGTLGLGGGVVGVAGDKTTKEAELGSTESRLVRHHTEASIFIALHDELRRTDRISDGADVSTLHAGDIVSLVVGPAVAPLRRVVDQLIRLLDVAAPLVGLGDDDQAGPDNAAQNRQQRRQAGRQAPKQPAASEHQDPGLDQLRGLKGLLVALRDDLDQSGMIDVVVAREDGPNVVLTLDKRFATDQALELMHSSSFTVVGKVTQVWPADTDVVNLYRRSVLSLLPALGQTVTWGMLTLLATVAGSLDPAAAERAAYAAAGLKQAGSSADASNEKGDAAEDSDEPDTQGSEQTEIQTAAAQVEEEQPEIMLGEAVEALTPSVSGPAFQLLPLAICA